jgi:two-component system chemotaxis response regulator CheB
MTGMGRDGALGMKIIHDAGGMTIAENRETSIVFGMPHEAIKLGAAQKIVPNYEIANEIVNAVNIQSDG